MRRIAEVDPREPSRRDRYRADRRVIILPLETLEDVFHLRDRDEMVLASEALRSAAPQIDAEAVNRTVDLDMAVRRHVVDRHPQRRVLSHGETEQRRGGKRAQPSGAEQKSGRAQQAGE